MHWPSFFVLLVYISGYLFILFAAVCLACGLYYLAELAEEYTSLTNKVLRYILYAELLMHVILLLYEKFEWIYVLFGIATHVSYGVILQNFPFIEPKSLKFIVACVMFILNNVAWFRFFSQNHELFYQYRLSPTPAVASFFLLLVWTLPVGLFVSLTVNDNVLPGGADIPRRGGAGKNALDGSMNGGETKKRTNILQATHAAMWDFIDQALQKLGLKKAPRAHGWD